jgi:glycosyltransferase involved in cell wall biosynthesis
MRIAIVSPPWYAVPPRAYGGTELVVHLLTEGLVREGMDVTLFASGDSETGARLVSAFDEAPSERIGETTWELAHVLRACEQADRFDVVHDHSGPLGLSLLATRGVPVVHTVHGPVDEIVGDVYARACRGGCAGLTSLSFSQRSPRPDLPWIDTVPNAIDVESYPLRPQGEGEYLLFLGRMCLDKGAHRAIEVARAAGLPLKMAAKCREPEEKHYFERFVEPQLGDGIEYLGKVSLREKVSLLHGALATLAPIEWEEPFGLVLVESAACGTPVIATRRGAVPEVVVDGVTGVVVESHEDMPGVLERAVSLDRDAMRAEVARRFDVSVMVERYLEVYELAIRRIRRRRPTVGRAEAARRALQHVVAQGQDKAAAAAAASGLGQRAEGA